MRVLAIDAGMTCGYGAIGGDKAVSSGSHRLKGDARHLGIAGRHFDRLFRELLLKERPTIVAFASPFVGMKTPKAFIKDGRFIQPKAAAIQPDSIRPLMGFLMIVETVCDELRVRCIELDEPEARRAFMTGVPRKSKDIKLAIMAACRMRGWPVCDDHAGDALCIASRALEIIGGPQAAHEITPLFTASPVVAKQRKGARV